MNKSTIGLKHAMYAGLTESSNSVTYANGVELPGAISAEISIEKDDVKLYGDNRVVHATQNFKQGTINFTAAAFTDAAIGALTGATVSSGVITYKASDVAPFVGFGFIADGVTEANGQYSTGYTAVMLHKVQFSEGAVNAQTRGDSTSYSSPVLNGVFVADVTDTYKEIETFDTESAAVTWLKGKLNVQ